MKVKFPLIETLFLIYYLLYPFYIFFILAYDGEFRFNSFIDFIYMLIPSLISWSLTFLYLKYRNKVSGVKSIILFVTIFYHFIIIYLLFFFFTTNQERKEYIPQNIISSIGILLTILVLFTNLSLDRESNKKASS